MTHSFSRLFPIAVLVCACSTGGASSGPAPECSAAMGHAWPDIGEIECTNIGSSMQSPNDCLTPEGTSCDTCVHAHCCAELEACANDPTCGDKINCTAKCTMRPVVGDNSNTDVKNYDACMAKCDTSAPKAGSAQFNLRRCITTSQCTYDDGEFSATQACIVTFPALLPGADDGMWCRRFAAQIKVLDDTYGCGFTNKSVERIAATCDDAAFTVYWPLACTAQQTTWMQCITETATCTPCASECAALTACMCAASNHDPAVCNAPCL